MKALRMSERLVCHLQELNFSALHGMKYDEMRVEKWKRFFLFVNHLPKPHPMASARLS